MKTLVERKDQQSVLAQWRGARARIWIFDVSLTRMAIRIYRPHEKEVVYVIGVNCEFVAGPFSWEDADVSVELEPVGAEIPKRARVVDEKAGFELRCADARVLRGPATDFEKTFENFLGEEG